ncbi:glycoside hydrolase family 75 protein [Streptomyces xanthii]|uniref:glycoside hydrolase family 75 protein n=1 Tax=Streptomyces xanthii TaxID=2768069 RepID=UPI001CB78A20|nr:glycoside hydrolase family 75 protein [Streptomyces xanthii]
MRPRLLPLTALCGAALLAPASLAASAAPPPAERAHDSGTTLRVRPVAAPAPAAPFVREGGVRADALRAAVRGCRQISNGRYRTDDGTRADIPVCRTQGAVHWKADLDVDCDGRAGRRCNGRTDPVFQNTTAYQQSDGRPLNAETLPYVVVPAAGELWKPARSGIRAGTVAALVHKDRVVYAVVGDVGPADLIGEASYAAARALGVDPHPVRGGVAASDVTYILFPGRTVRPVESHRAAVRAGHAAARELVSAAAR